MTFTRVSLCARRSTKVLALTATSVTAHATCHDEGLSLHTTVISLSTGLGYPSVLVSGRGPT
jgi:hypothetical protein